MYSVMALVFGLVGGVLLVYGLVLAKRAHSSRRWPEAEGKITSVNVAKIWIGRGSIYFPEVRYQFTVGETRVEGSRIGFAAILPRFSHGATVYALQHSYPRGHAVTVRYNPANQSDAVLEPGIRPGLRTILGSAVLLVLIALAAALASRFLDGAA